MEHFTLRELEASGLHYFRSEDYPRALELFKRIAQSDQVSINNFAHLGRVYAKLKLFDEAREALEVYVDQVPESYLERFQLGLVLMELGNLELSLEQWDNVLNLQPNFPPALYYKSVLCVMKQDYVSAKFLLEQLLETTEQSNLYHQFATELSEKVEQQSQGIPVSPIDTSNQYQGEFNVE